MPKKMCALTINSMQLDVHIGWANKERVKKQPVLVDIDIAFANTPKACLTDHLDDAVCYDSLITQLRQQLGKKKFCLVEHLAHDIFTIIKSLLPKQTKLQIGITKYPAIKNLNGGVSFYYGDK
jgi:dihydroneopterin aldolase